MPVWLRSAHAGQQRRLGRTHLLPFASIPTLLLSPNSGALGTHHHIGTAVFLGFPFLYPWFSPKREDGRYLEGISRGNIFHFAQFCSVSASLTQKRNNEQYGV